jgi:hypothetical protein
MAVDDHGVQPVECHVSDLVEIRRVFRLVSKLLLEVFVLFV